MPTRPILALDVDGPIALMGNPSQQGVFDLEVNGIPLQVSRQLPRFLGQLSEHFRIVWSSTWGKRASLKLAPLVGLPVGLPFIPFDRYLTGVRARPGLSYKLPGLQAYLGDCPAAIVDDEIGLDLAQWAKNRPDTLLVEIDPRNGITAQDVRRLVDFAHRLS